MLQDRAVMNHWKEFTAFQRYPKAINAFLESLQMKTIYCMIRPIVPSHDYLKTIRSLLQHYIYYGYCYCKLRSCCVYIPPILIILVGLVLVLQFY
jgi:hypothetical protein